MEATEESGTEVPATDEAESPEQVGPEVPWWGTLDIPLGSARRWTVGPLTLRVIRREGEWRIERESSDDPFAVGLEIGVAESADAKPLATSERVGFSGNETALRIEAALPDRSLVSRPESTFLLPADERQTVYVGTSLWLRLLVGNRLLADIPTLRASDTFFGKTTMEGELCYASRTYCRVRLGDTKQRAHRALTAVEIRNLTQAPLPLERIKLPVAYLALYRGSDGRLWTQDVVFERREDGDEARLPGGKPSRAPEAELLSPPRIADQNLMERTFASLFGGAF